MGPNTLRIFLLLSTASLTLSNDLFSDELNQFWHNVDKEFDRISRVVDNAFNESSWLQPVNPNSFVEGDTFKIVLKLPGVEESDIVVQPKGKWVEIKAYHKEPGNPSSEIGYHHIQAIPARFSSFGKWMFTKDKVFTYILQAKTPIHEDSRDTNHQKRGSVIPKYHEMEIQPEVRATQYHSSSFRHPGNNAQPESTVYRQQSGSEMVDGNPNIQRNWEASQSNSQSHYQIDRNSNQGNTSPQQSQFEGSDDKINFKVNVQHNHFETKTDYVHPQRARNSNGWRNPQPPVNTGATYPTTQRVDNNPQSASGHGK